MTRDSSGLERSGELRPVPPSWQVAINVGPAARVHTSTYTMAEPTLEPFGQKGQLGLSIEELLTYVAYLDIYI